MSHLQSEATYFIGGTNSIYVPYGRQKYVDKSACKPWADIEGHIRLHTPGEAARVELQRQWPNLKRVGWSPGHVTLLDKRSPLFYTGPAVGYMMYVDLVGAYRQIYENLWLDTSYPRAYHGLYPLYEVAQTLDIWKGARNALMGIVRSREAVAYRGLKRIPLKIQNKYLSPGLWATVQEILHWLMAEAIGAGAIYGNVDGYIFHDIERNYPTEFLSRISDLGFRWSIRAIGTGEIRSWNNYHVGAVRTKANELNLTHNSKEFSNVSSHDAAKWETYWAGCRRIACAKRDTYSSPPTREANICKADTRD